MTWSEVNGHKYLVSSDAESAKLILRNAIQAPSVSPLIINLWGVNGVGKTAIGFYLSEVLKSEANFIQFSPRIGEKLSPIDFIKLLNNRIFGNATNSFSRCLEEYEKALLALQTQPLEGATTVSKDQTEAVKRLLSAGLQLGVAKLAGVQTAIASTPFVSAAAGMIVDTSTVALSLKDEVFNVLNRHKATKNKQAIQDLLLNPLTILVEKFSKDLNEHSQRLPIVLMFDDFDKTMQELQECLWILALTTGISALPIRIFVCSTNPVDRGPWKALFIEKEDLLRTQRVKGFKLDEIQKYLKLMAPSLHNKAKEISIVTGGNPFMVEWITKHSSTAIDLNLAKTKMVDLISVDLSEEQKILLGAASCFRQFSREQLEFLCDEIPSEKFAMYWNWLVGWCCSDLPDTFYIDEPIKGLFRWQMRSSSPSRFFKINEKIAAMIKGRLAKLLPAEQSPPSYILCDDCIDLIAECLYYTLHSDCNRRHVEFLNIALECALFDELAPVRACINWIKNEEASYDQTDYFLLKESLKFVRKIRPYVENPLYYQLSLLRNYVMSGGIRNLFKSIANAIEDYDKERKAAIEYLVDFVDLADGLAQVYLVCLNLGRPGTPGAERTPLTKKLVDSIGIVKHPIALDFVYTRLAKGFLQLRDLDSVIECSELVLQTHQNSLNALQWKAIALMLKSEFELAISAAREWASLASSNDDKYRAIFFECICLLGLKRWQEIKSSRDKFIAAMNFQSNDDSGYLLLSYVHLITNELEEAERFLLLSNEEGPNSDSVKAMKVWLTLRKGSRGDAIKELNAMLTLSNWETVKGWMSEEPELVSLITDDAIDPPS